MSEPSSTDLLLLFQRAQAQFTDRVDAVAPGQWDVPALPGRSVADLVAHLTREQLTVPALLTGEVAEQLPTATDELLGADPLTAWETAADDALTVWASPGALDGTVRLPGGSRPAVDHLVAMTTHLTVHAWDVARAVDGVTALDEELVAAAHRAVRDHLGEDWLDVPIEVPSDADPQTRLLARFGRRA